MTLLELWIAWRYLRSKRMDSFIKIAARLSIASITLGVASLVIVTSVMNGYRADLISKLRGISSDMTISAWDTTKSFDAKSTIAKLSAISGTASPVVEQRAVAMSDKSVLGFVAKGVEPSGSYSAIKRGEILIGKDLARNLALRNGDSVSVAAASLDEASLNKMMKLKVKDAALATNFFEYDAVYAIMHIDDARDVFGLRSGSASQIEIALSKSADLATERRKAAIALGGNFLITDWQGRSAHIVQALRVEKTAMCVILGLITLVAGFSIVSAAVMLVTIKQREIAVMRAIGLSKGSIVRIFLTVGTSLAAIGIALGLSLGLAISLNVEAIRKFLSGITGVTLFDPVVYFLETLPSQIDWLEVCCIAAISLVVSILASIVPALRAGSISPASGLKND